MAEFAALPLFTDSWVADTAHLSRLERGIYMDLLVLMWRSPECRVPNDPTWIARRLRLDQQEQSILKNVTAEFCFSDGNWLMQKRLRREYLFVAKKRDAQSVKAKSRWNKEKDLSRGNAPSPTPTPTPTPTISPSPPQPASPERPESLPPNRGDGTGALPSFDDVDRALRAIPGLDAHPVATTPSIAPIWRLISAGLDFKTQILPSIKTQLAKTGKRQTIRSWNYFVPGIEADVQPATLSASFAVTDDEWLKRLAAGRQTKLWQTGRYGPMPGTAGCRVPAHLLTAGDGSGWREWKPAA